MPWVGRRRPEAPASPLLPVARRAGRYARGGSEVSWSLSANCLLGPPPPSRAVRVPLQRAPQRPPAATALRNNQLPSHLRVSLACPRPQATGRQLRGGPNATTIGCRLRQSWADDALGLAPPLPPRGPASPPEPGRLSPAFRLIRRAGGAGTRPLPLCGDYTERWGGLRARGVRTAVPEKLPALCRTIFPAYSVSGKFKIQMNAVTDALICGLTDILLIQAEKYH
ncbi:hypothetical protein H8959_021410 [Pygathrix nigripes]